MRRIFFVAGVLSSLTYVAIDLLSAARYPGYDLAHQAISELSAIGAPESSLSLWRLLGPTYGLLFLVFTVAVIRLGRDNVWLRRSGWAMLAFVAWNLLWPFFPMNQREAAKTASDIGHLVIGGGSLVLILGFIGLGMPALGGQFRRFSLASLIVIGLTGIGTFLYLPAMGAGGATPWLGIVERLMIYGYLLWVAVLAVALMRRVPEIGGPAAVVPSRA